MNTEEHIEILTSSDTEKCVLPKDENGCILTSILHSNIRLQENITIIE
jgi:hypothetical protein